MEDILQRITFRQGVLGGKPIIRGLRISVEMILDLVDERSIRAGNPGRLIPNWSLMICGLPCSYAHHLVAGETILDRVAVYQPFLMFPTRSCTMAGQVSIHL